MRILPLLLVLILLPWAARADACYSPTEAEADQGIRIHSELMVIGLNCQHMGLRHGDDLYLRYRQFTDEHADLFSQYEQILMSFFSKSGDKNPEASLNALRTQYANKISNDAAAMRPDIFCATYAPRVTKAAGMNREELRKWAATIFPSHPVSHPVCGG